MPKSLASATPQGASHSPRTRSLNFASRSMISTGAPRSAIALAIEAPPRPPPTVMMS